MLDRILLLIDFSRENEAYFKDAIEVAKRFNSQIIAFNVVDINTINLIAKHTGKRESEVAVDLEENGWRYLYSFEDLAKDEGIKTLIHQEEGIFESAVIDAVHKYNISLVIIKKRLNLGIQSSVKLLERIIEKIDCPLLLI